MTHFKFAAVTLALGAVFALTPAMPDIAVAQKATSDAKSSSAKSKPKTRKASTGSACKGLNRSACGTSRVGCTWVQPKKKVDVRGRKLTAYCRKVARRKTN